MQETPCHESTKTSEPNQSAGPQSDEMDVILGANDVSPLSQNIELGIQILSEQQHFAENVQLFEAISRTKSSLEADTPNLTKGLFRELHCLLSRVSGFIATADLAGKTAKDLGDTRNREEGASRKEDDPFYAMISSFVNDQDPDLIKIQITYLRMIERFKEVKICEYEEQVKLLLSVLQGMEGCLGGVVGGVFGFDMVSNLQRAFLNSFLSSGTEERLAAAATFIRSRYSFSGNADSKGVTVKMFTPYFLPAREQIAESSSACDFILMPTPPDFSMFGLLELSSESAYVKVGDMLYHVSKGSEKYTLFHLPPKESLTQIAGEINFGVAKRLSENELEQIASITSCSPYASSENYQEAICSGVLIGGGEPACSWRLHFKNAKDLVSVIMETFGVVQKTHDNVLTEQSQREIFFFQLIIQKLIEQSRIDQAAAVLQEIMRLDEEKNTFLAQELFLEMVRNNMRISNGSRESYARVLLLNMKKEEGWRLIDGFVEKDMALVKAEELGDESQKPLSSEALIQASNDQDRPYLAWRVAEVWKKSRYSSSLWADRVRATAWDNVKDESVKKAIYPFGLSMPAKDGHASSAPQRTGWVTKLLIAFTVVCAALAAVALLTALNIVTFGALLPITVPIIYAAAALGASSFGAIWCAHKVDELRKRDRAERDVARCCARTGATLKRDVESQPQREDYAEPEIPAKPRLKKIRQESCARSPSLQSFFEKPKEESSHNSQEVGHTRVRRRSMP